MVKPKNTPKEAEEAEFFTKAELKKIVQELLDGQTKDLRGIIETLQAELEETTNIATGALRRVEECEKSIVHLQTENEDLKNEIARSANLNRIKVLEERIEERTNRQMRNTLVFKGISDDLKETWSQTEQKLVDHITKAGVSANNAYDMIERAHRGRPHPEKKGPRPIYARFFSWKDSEHVKKLKLTDEQSNRRVFVDQKYGPLTTQRRNRELLERKGLKAEGKIVQGYLKFPAQLWVKYNHEDVHYQRHTDFSKYELN